jgi:hypothetical protein
VAHNDGLIEFLTTAQAGREADPPMSIQSVIFWCKKHPEVVAGRIAGARVIHAEKWRALMKKRRISPWLARQLAGQGSSSNVAR